MPLNSSEKVQKNCQLRRVENSHLCVFFVSFNQFCLLRQCRYYFSRNTITGDAIVLFVRVPDIFAHAQGQKLRDEQLFPS